MNVINKENNLYKTTKENGYLDFPNINARVLYYHDEWTGYEYSITLDLKNLNNVINIEQFETSS